MLKIEKDVSEKEAPFNPYLAILIGVVFLSTASIIIKFSTAHFIVIAFYRVFFAAILLFCFTPGQIIREVKRLDIKTLGIIFLSGVFLAAHFSTWILSLEYTTISNSVLIVDSAPIIAMVGAHFALNEKITWVTLAAVLVSFAGAGLIVWGDVNTSAEMFKGDMLALAGAVSGAFYIISGRFIRKNVGVSTYSVLVYMSTALVLLVYCLVFGVGLTNFEYSNYYLFILLALLPTIGGHTLFQYALGYLKAYLVNLGFLGEPIGATVLAFFFFNEVPTEYFFPGAVLVLGGMGLAVYKEHSIKKSK